MNEKEREGRKRGKIDGLKKSPGHEEIAWQLRALAVFERTGLDSKQHMATYE